LSAFVDHRSIFEVEGESMSVPNEERVSVVLSREELAVILRLLGSTEMLGYENSWLQTSPDGSLPADTRRVLEVAANGLIARGYLTAAENTYPPQDLQITMPAPLIAIVAACVFGEYSVFLAVRDAKEHRQAFFHELQGLAVAHTLPRPGLHQFDALNGREGVLRMVMAILGIDNQQSLQLPPFAASADILEQANDKALKGHAQEAEQQLIQSGMPVPIAQQLTTTIRDAVALGAITATGPKSPSSVTVGVAASKAACFLLTRDSPQETQLTIKSVAAQTIRDWLTTHIG
jgi:hypothetical protein